jgi:DNA mismatch repair protein MutL
VEQGDGLLLIDKHAAHERILFERLKAQSHEIMSQLLLSPQHLSLSQEESAVLLEQLELLSDLGFTLEDFGDGDLLLRAVPADIDPQDAPACLSELAQQLLTGKKPDQNAVFDELLHTVACKAAIKGGQKSDPLELSSLVSELMSRDDIKYCPHGRPVCISLSRKTIERQFKRT